MVYLQTMNLTPQSKKLLQSIINDLPNWDNCTPTYNHVRSQEDKGKLTDLKKKDLIYLVDGEWIEVTP